MQKLRGALIGYGFIMEKGHAAGYQQRGAGAADVEIVAIADISPGQRAIAQATWPNARLYDDCAGAAGGRVRQARLRRHRHPAQPPRGDRPRGAVARAARPLRKAAGRDDRRGALDAASGGQVGAGDLPLPQLQARAGDQDGARPPQDRPHRQGPPGDVADLPQHARQGRHRLAHRLAARAPLLGRRHRHGSRQPHVLPGVRVAGVVPDRHHRAGGDAGAVRHRGRLRLQPALSHRHRLGAPVVERRRSQGALHAARRARRHPRRGRRRRAGGAGARRRAAPAPRPGRSSGRRSRPTGWTPAT